MTRFLITMIFLFPLFLTAETIIVKTKAPQNRNAVFQYRVPKGYDKNRREMYRVLVIFGGRNTDGKADASGRMGWGKWCDDNGIFLVAPGLKNDNYWEPEVRQAIFLPNTHGTFAMLLSEPTIATMHAASAPQVDP
ncbi:MAG: hypothetical protein IKA22_12710 [Lentisphaeria bacterium]|nr:hypothetical protein [Lentisphaeria bacterium]